MKSGQNLPASGGWGVFNAERRGAKGERTLFQQIMRETIRPNQYQARQLWLVIAKGARAGNDTHGASLEYGQAWEYDPHNRIFRSRAMGEEPATIYMRRAFQNWTSKSENERKMNGSVFNILMQDNS